MLRKIRCHLIVAGTSLAVALYALPVPAGESETGRGSVPPGTSQDGSRASEGAIVGGSMDRERSDRGAERAREVDRCRDLDGTLRKQCIEDARKGNEPARPPK